MHHPCLQAESGSGEEAEDEVDSDEEDDEEEEEEDAPPAKKAKVQHLLTVHTLCDKHTAFILSRCTKASQLCRDPKMQCLHLIRLSRVCIDRAFNIIVSSAFL